MLKGKLARLIQENPNLPVIMCVDSSIICCDWYSWWLGSIDSVEVSKYCHYDGNVWRYGDCVPNANPSDLQWTDAIIVKVGLPKLGNDLHKGR